MTTFWNLSVKHYRVDEFNYIDILNSQTRLFWEICNACTTPPPQKKPHNIPSRPNTHTIIMDSITYRTNNPKFGSKISKMLIDQFGMIPFKICSLTMMSLSYF